MQRNETTAQGDPEMKMQRVGYGRVSTADQNLNLQLDSLKAAGCAEIFTDRAISGANFERPGLTAALTKLRAGDTLVVWRLDRLGRSIADLIEIVGQLGKRNIEFHSLNEKIDTSTPTGRLTFHLMAAMAEFERQLIGERTKAGMQAARARGSRIGRRPAMTTLEITEARSELAQAKTSASEIAERHGIHVRTLRRLVRQADLI